MIKKFYLSILLTLSFLPAMASDDLYPFESSVQKEQFTKLTQEVRCLVCQNQAISDSNAPFASDLRAEIYRLINQKKSNEEIKTYLSHRYGDYVLLDPTVSKQTWLLWTSPILLIIIGAIVLTRTVRNKS